VKRRLLLLALFLMTYGCSGGEGNLNDPPKRVPIKGTVRLDGKPLTGAVVVFLPSEDGKGTLTQGETGEDGTYELLYMAQPGGTAPGRYRVIISYLVAPDGTPQGLGPRSSMTPTESFLKSKELLPTKYSDPTRSELTAVVSDAGGTINHDLIGPLAPPSPEPATGAGQPLDGSLPPSNAKQAAPPA